ncbi:MAG TPA: TldD/PmbA family protein [Candidatus Limnocylindria bacterium]|nr:TldD/PmbA family protein [Candidatus Limnocylindria bacterium]
MTAPNQDLSETDASAAARLRERFGFLREVVAELEREVPYASALVRQADGIRIQLRDGDQQAGRQDPQAGVVLTVSNGAYLEEAATDRTDPDAVRQLARELAERARSHRPRAGEPALQLATNGVLEADFATPMQRPPNAESLVEKLERYESLRQRLRAVDSRAVQAICTYGHNELSEVFVRRDGMVTQQLRRVVLALIVFVSDGQQRQYAYRGSGATGGLEHIEVDDADLHDLAGVAVSMLSAKPVPPGTYDVVADPATAGTIAHEAFGHGVETDMFVKGRARAADFIGRQVGSDLVNILDDPTLAGAYGSYFVDDEGQPAAPTTIIRNGVFERGLTDLYSASRLGVARSANGRRQSVHRKAYARMSNTYFAPGTSSRQEVLESLDDGLLLCDALNGMEDPKGWGIQIWAHHAREYRGGRPTGIIYAPVAITGYVPDVLRDVTMVSDELAMSPGTCGKGWKELVPVSSGGPYLRTRCRLG